MQVFVNERHIAQRRTFGRAASVAGLAMLGVGFLLSLTEQFVTLPGLGTVPALLISYLLLFPGIVIFNIGRYNAIRWGVRPREDEVVTAALKGLDNRHHLYHYMPQVPDAKHFLIGPAGVLLIEVRSQMGEIYVDGDRWSRAPGFGALLRGIAEGSLGNPAHDAERHERQLRAYLSGQVGQELADAVPFEAVAVFVNPRVQLVIQREPTIPVRLPRDLKAFVRKITPTRADQRLSDAELAKLWAAFEG